MNKEKFLDELLRYVYENSITIKTITEDGEDKSYTIENRQDFIGKAKNKYESLLFERYAYDNLESTGIDMYDYIVNELKEKIVDVAPTIQAYKDEITI